MTKLRILFTVASLSLLGGCASFDFDQLNPFSSGDEEKQINDSVIEQEVSEQQLEQMHRDWTSLKPELMQLLTLESDIAQLKQELEQHKEMIETLESASKSMTKPMVKEMMSEPEAIGNYSFQIAAATTKEAAEQAWTSQKRKFSNFLSQYQPRYKQLMKGNKEFFRVLVGNFDTNSEALGTCGSFQSIGGQCMVRKNQ